MSKSIKILNAQDCCGCSACKNVCPKQCITMRSDKFGFKYPYVDSAFCVNCGLCIRVCPFINENNSDTPIETLAAINKNENDRTNSSSGGVFIKLAEGILAKGGVVFGAVFDENWNVKHSYADSISLVHSMMGSKYVQSEIGNSYLNAKKFLDSGRQVLFSGTPCQIAGLKHYLNRSYDNLLCVEVVCHGVPSPLLWQKYLESIDTDKTRIAQINFRDKRNGWKNFGLSISFKDNESHSIYESTAENVYMRMFLSNRSLRPSCFNCKAKAGKSKADIGIGDFWGIEKIANNIPSHNGVSLLLSYTEKGLEEINKLDIFARKVSYLDVIELNYPIVRSVPVPAKQNKFWNLVLNRNLSKVSSFLDCPFTVPERIFRKICALLKRL